MPARPRNERLLRELDVEFVSKSWSLHVAVEPILNLLRVFIRLVFAHKTSLSALRSLPFSSAIEVPEILSKKADEKTVGKGNGKSEVTLLPLSRTCQAENLVIGSPPRNRGLERQNSVQLMAARPSGVQTDHF